jgi:hypothetical protein
LKNFIGGFALRGKFYLLMLQKNTRAEKNLMAIKNFSDRNYTTAINVLKCCGLIWKEPASRLNPGIIGILAGRLFSRLQRANHDFI